MITYVTGDATDPWVKGNKIIAHVCNDIGGWGRGFVLALTRRWPLAEASYRRWYDESSDLPGMEDQPFTLGNVQFVCVKDDEGTRTMVANMVAQRDIVTQADGTPPIRYEALRSCLRKVGEMARAADASVHMPRIGCGLAGGKWDKVEPILHDELDNVDVYVYDL